MRYAESCERKGDRKTLPSVLIMMVNMKNGKHTLGSNTNGWNIKYFKGLGTSTAVEFKEYFANKKIVECAHSGPESDDTIDKIFNKKTTGRSQIMARKLRQNILFKYEFSTSEI
jgi:DNA gyrase/topoisomerase IV subunit B